MTAVSRPPSLCTYDVTASSRMIGSWRRASAAAFKPSSTSWLGAYLLSGGTIRVCADAPVSVSATASAQATALRLISLRGCKKGNVTHDVLVRTPLRQKLTTAAGARRGELL